jgi:hypothetical protein
MSATASLISLPTSTFFSSSFLFATSIPRFAASSKVSSAATADAKKCSTRVPSKPTTKFTFPGLWVLTSSSMASSRHLDMYFALSDGGMLESHSV